MKKSILTAGLILSFSVVFSQQEEGSQSPSSSGSTTRRESAMVNAPSATVSEALVYPNPASTSVQIRLSEGISGPHSIEVYDLTGTLVQRLHTDDIGNGTTLDVDQFRDGMYIVWITDDKDRDRRHHGTVVIKK